MSEKMNIRDRQLKRREKLNELCTKLRETTLTDREATIFDLGLRFGQTFVWADCVDVDCDTGDKDYENLVYRILLQYGYVRDIEKLLKEIE